MCSNGNLTNGPTSHEKLKKISGSIESNKFSQETRPDGKVLVLYTGGTIGMVRNDRGVLVPLANAFVKNLRRYPNLHDKSYADERFGPMGPLVLPLADGKDRRRVIYSVLEYSPLCDSSNMTMDDWIRIAEDIKESYEHFDGFVILHGTDTLCYTASALSFMLEALGKIVILTGSQLPIFDVRSDGLDNFLASLVIAANYNIPEVCIFFGTKLMRGNRTIKESIHDFEAFHSPNVPPLALVGIKIEVDYQSIIRSCLLEKFNVHTKLNRNVGLLRLFPSITVGLVRAFLQPPIEGVVLQTYGAGNFPSNRQDIIEELKKATDRGVIIINITQCTKGTVSNSYETGHVLTEAGLTCGFDMTPEAAVSKLSYVLSKSEWDTATKRSLLATSLRGELTSGRSPVLPDWDLVNALEKSLHTSSPMELRHLSFILFPAMMISAVLAKDIAKVDSLAKYGGDISQPNADGRTALHIACCEGDYSIVKHLLKMGGNVHVKDRFDRTPLSDAIDYDHHEIIKLLLQCGAHLHERGHVIGEKMCTASAAGNVLRLKSYLIAGADLSQSDVSGRTALHLASLCNQSLSVKFLLDSGVDVQSRDATGHTARDLAELAGSEDCLNLLS